MPPVQVVNNKESEMTSYKRIATTLLIAGALLAGCDVSSPGGATTPTPAATPAASPTPATIDTPAASPAGDATAYPVPVDATPTFAPGYVPPTPPK
jgi:hypothetical protein